MLIREKVEKLTRAAINRPRQFANPHRKVAPAASDEAAFYEDDGVAYCAQGGAKKQRS